MKPITIKKKNWTNFVIFNKTGNNYITIIKIVMIHKKAIVRSNEIIIYLKKYSNSVVLFNVVEN